jgi:hypothetical protein
MTKATQNSRQRIWLLLGLSSVAAAAVGRAYPGPRVMAADAGRATVPASFEIETAGTRGAPARFTTRQGAYRLIVAPAQVVINPAADPAASPLRLRLAGANHEPEITGVEAMPGKVNYFLPRDPERRFEFPIRGGVWYEGVYAGVDLVYRAGSGRLTCEFVVAPEADPGVVQWLLGGAQALRSDASGGLLLQSAAGGIRLSRPEAYQETLGVRQEVSCDYVTNGDRLGLRVGAYEADRPLLVDCVLNLE